MGVEVGILVPLDASQEVGYGEQGTRTEPTRHIIVRDVVEQRLGRHREDVILQVLEVAHAHHLLHGSRVAEDKVAETEVMVHQVLEVDIQLLRVLVEERGSIVAGLLGDVGLRRFHDEGQELILLTNGRQQVEPGTLVLHPATGKTAIADDSQGVVLVFAIQFPGLLVGAGQHNLWASSHAQCLKLGVQCLGGKLKALLQHELIEVWQDAGIEADVVLDKHNHLHAGLSVVLQVHLVLNQLNDGQEQLGVTQPAEHIFEDAQVFVLHALRNAV